MLRGYRLLFTAIGLVAATTCAIGWWTFPISPATQEFRYDNPRNDNYHPGGRKCEPSALRAIINTQIRLDQTDHCQKEAEEYRQASDDLIQQTRAANAAQAQANIATQQLWTVWLQTLGGFITLSAAIAAAIYAREAARAGRASLDATIAFEDAVLSFEAVRITRTLEGGKDFWKVGLRVYNLGRSNALLHLVSLDVAENSYEAIISAGANHTIGDFLVPVGQILGYDGIGHYSTGIYSWSKQNFYINITEKPGKRPVIRTFPGETEHKARKVSN